MNIDTPDSADTAQRHSLSWAKILLIVLLTILVTAGITFWLIKAYIFPSEFRPVFLNAKEEQVLNAKLRRLESLDTVKAPAGGDSGKSGLPMEPERYSEEGATREIVLSEREVNGLLAKNTELARKLAIDLSGDLVSAKLLMPVDEDFPILGGQILKVRAGVQLAYTNGKPVVMLRGVSVMGVPVPNAWLGGIKNIDLVQEYGAHGGFWESFSEGVEDIHVEEGRLKIKLKE